MADVKMSDLGADTSVAGTEKLLVLDGTTSKTLTTAKMAEYAIDVLVVAAEATPTAGDDFLAVRAGAEKRLDLDAVGTYIVGAAFDSAAITTLASGDLILAEQAADGARKVITAANLAAYVAGTITTTYNFSSMDAVSAVAGTDVFALDQGAATKKLTYTQLSTKLWSELAANVAGFASIASPSDADLLYVSSGGVDKSLRLDILAAYVKAEIAPVVGPAGATTANMVPQWDSAALTIKEGLTVETTVRASASAVDTALATEKAIRTAVDAAVGDITNINLDGGTDIGAALADADLILVDDGASGTNRKSTFTRVWTWITGKIQALSAKTTPVDADILVIQDSADSDALKELTVANLWDNRYLADAKAIKLDEFAAGTDVTTLNATTSVHGLLPKLGGGSTNFLRADGTWAEPGVAVGWDGDIGDVDLDGGTDIGADLVDADLILVDDGAGGTNRKSAISRLWTYIWAKFTAADTKGTGIDADSVPLQDTADSNAVKRFTLASLWAYVEQKIIALSAKTTGVDADILTIQDSAASNVLKEFTLANLFVYVQSKFIARTAKTTPVNADYIPVEDSAASFALKRSTVANLWTNRYLLDAKAIKIDEFSAGTDVTTLNVSTSAHGLCPKLSNNARQFLRGDGSYATYASLTATPVAAAGSVYTDAAAMGTTNTGFITSDSAAKDRKSVV